MSALFLTEEYAMYYALFESGHLGSDIIKFLLVMFALGYVLRLLVIAVSFLRMRLCDKEGFDRYLAENEIKLTDAFNPFSKKDFFPGRSSPVRDTSEDDNKKVLCKATARVIGKQEVKAYGTDEEGRPTTHVTYQLRVKFYVGNTAATASLGSATYDETVEIYYNKDDLTEVYLTSDERFKTGFTMADFTFEGIRRAKDKVGDKIMDAAQKNIIVNIIVNVVSILILVLVAKLNSSL